MQGQQSAFLQMQPGLLGSSLLGLGGAQGPPLEAVSRCRSLDGELSPGLPPAPLLPCASCLLNRNNDVGNTTQTIPRAVLLCGLGSRFRGLQGRTCSRLSAPQSRPCHVSSTAGSSLLLCSPLRSLLPKYGRCQVQQGPASPEGISKSPTKTTAAESH